MASIAVVTVPTMSGVMVGVTGTVATAAAIFASTVASMFGVGVGSVSEHAIKIASTKVASETSKKRPIEPLIAAV